MPRRQPRTGRHGDQLDPIALFGDPDLSCEDTYDDKCGSRNRIWSILFRQGQVQRAGHCFLLLLCWKGALLADIQQMLTDFFGLPETGTVVEGIMVRGVTRWYLAALVSRGKDKQRTAGYLLVRYSTDDTIKWPVFNVFREEQ